MTELLKITMEPVANSSQVKAIGYDSATQTLAVKFHTGDEYRYMQVPADEVQAMRECKSAGKFLSLRIKGRFKFEKVGVA